LLRRMLSTLTQSIPDGASVSSVRVEREYRTERLYLLAIASADRPGARSDAGQYKTETRWPFAHEWQA